MKKILFVLVVLFASCSNDVGRYEYVGSLYYHSLLPDEKTIYFDWLEGRNYSEWHYNRNFVMNECIKKYGRLDDTTCFTVHYDTKTSLLKFNKYDKGFAEPKFPNQ